MRDTQFMQPRSATTRPRPPRASIGTSKTHSQAALGRATAKLANATDPPMIRIDRISRAGRFQLATLYGPQKHTVWTMRQVGHALIFAMRSNAAAQTPPTNGRERKCIALVRSFCSRLLCGSTDTHALRPVHQLPLFCLILEKPPSRQARAKFANHELV
jgi:hypothetical protein